MAVCVRARATPGRERSLLAALCGIAVWGLGCDAGSRAPAGSADGAAPREPLDAAAEPRWLDPSCQAPAGVRTDPHTIAETVDLLNALPRPLSVACFVGSLARPLALQAVDSTFSAQPAEGPRSPRVFIFFEGLTLSVVPDGPSAHLLEFGEARPDDQSLKAELEFPIERELDEAAPYERLPFTDEVTTCGLCHQGEVREPDVASPYALVSPALRPMPDQRVPLDALAAEAEACDPEGEPERCALLRALFAGEDPPLDHEFPHSYRTFF